MKNILNIQIASVCTKNLPKKDFFYKLVNIVLKNFQRTGEITIRIVDRIESQFINWNFRNKNIATNIISFRFINEFNINSNFLGDLIICNEVIEKEAIQYNKILQSHWAHIVLHGCLHLLGFDHINNFEKKKWN